MEYKEVQKIAKDTIKYAKHHIKPGISLPAVRKMLESKILELGVGGKKKSAGMFRTVLRPIAFRQIIRLKH